MGNGATVSVQKCIFVEHESKIYKISYPNKADYNELSTLIKEHTKTTGAYKIKLRNKNTGKFLRIDSDIQQNTIREPYSLEIMSDSVYGMNEFGSSDLTETKKTKKMAKSKEEMTVLYPKYYLSPETMERLRTPSFNIWPWKPDEMLSILEFMFEELGLIEEFRIDNTTLKRWLLCIQSNYQNNPFHNFRHCFCVSQMMYGLIYGLELFNIMNRTELGILFISAICHDLDHPGYNNLYQINARTELAIRYNDISPLENHHCAVAFKIVNNPLYNILVNVSNEKYREIRNGIVKLILATDMSRHKEIIGSFQQKLDGFDASNTDHMDSLKMILIKCCDISNEVRPFEVSAPWVDLLLEEYFMQSDREKREGLPVANYMDRDQVTKPNAQVGFITHVLMPMFEAVAKLFPQIENLMLKPLKESLNRYEELKRLDEQK